MQSRRPAAPGFAFNPAMVLRSVLVAFAALGMPVAWSAEGEISWDPKIATVSMEGASLSRVVFTDGKTNYELSVNTETTVEAGEGGAKFLYRRVPSASFTIRNAAQKLPLPPNPQKLEEYRRAALAYAPPDASDFTKLEETLDPLSINEWQSYRLDFSYNFYGRRARRSVTFLTFPTGQQAVLQTAADEADFAPALARSDRLMKSWHVQREDTQGN